MSPDFDPSTLAKHAAGPAGAVTAMLFMRGMDWKHRIAMVIAGSIMAFYGAPLIHHWTGGNEGLSGWLVGLFGMALVAKIFDTWEALELGPLLRKKIAAWLGVQE